jgi:hypothetical protein
MELCNLTPEKIIYVSEGGKLVELPSRGIAKCDVQTKEVVAIDGASIHKKKYGTPTGLPPVSVDADVFYIVTPDVYEAVKHFRYDVVVPEEPVYGESNTYKRLIAV